MSIYGAAGGGGGGITNSAGLDVIPKSDGTNLVASGMSDDGSFVLINAPTAFSCGDINQVGNLATFSVGGTITANTSQTFQAGDISAVGNSTKLTLNDAAESIRFECASMGFFGAAVITKPEVPAVASPQDIIDALVALGLISQAAP